MRLEDVIAAVAAEQKFVRLLGRRSTNWGTLISEVSEPNQPFLTGLLHGIESGYRFHIHTPDFGGMYPEIHAGLELAQQDLGFSMEQRNGSFDAGYAGMKKRIRFHAGKTAKSVSGAKVEVDTLLLDLCGDGFGYSSILHLERELSAFFRKNGELEVEAVPGYGVSITRGMLKKYAAGLCERISSPAFQISAEISDASIRFTRRGEHLDIPLGLYESQGVLPGTLQFDHLEIDNFSHTGRGSLQGLLTATDSLCGAQRHLLLGRAARMAQHRWRPSDLRKIYRCLWEYAGAFVSHLANQEISLADVNSYLGEHDILRMKTFSGRRVRGNGHVRGALAELVSIAVLRKMQSEYPLRLVCAESTGLIEPLNKHYSVSIGRTGYDLLFSTLEEDVCEIDALALLGSVPMAFEIKLNGGNLSRRARMNRRRILTDMYGVKPMLTTIVFGDRRDLHEYSVREHAVELPYAGLVDDLAGNEQFVSR